jgi:hypothetical protein
VTASPLRVAPARLRLWALALAGVGLAPIVGAFAFGYHDWPAFWSAGATVATPDLLDPVRHQAWQLAHDLPAAFFAYPPGTAWLFWPFALVPLPLGFVLHGLLMLACAVAAGWLAGPVYGLDRRVAVLATLAWAPVTASIVLGQNGPLGLLLAIVAIGGIVGGRATPAGLAIGLLLYKPTFAAPLVGLLILRRRAELGIVALVAISWYLAGVAASAGDWTWPVAWLNGLRGYLEADFAGNADKAISLPGLVARLPGVPTWLPLVVGAAVVALAIPRLVRAPMLEAASAASLIGVAASPHAWGYDAALVVPFLLWLLGDHGRAALAEPWRTRLIVAAYVLAPLWLVSRQTIVSVLAVVVLAMAAAWLFSPPPPSEAKA